MGGTIFFSYSRKDALFVKNLASALREAGAIIWLDVLDIKPSMKWDNEIQEALKSSETLIIVLSKNSVKSENVKDEFSYAISAGKKVVPVLIEDCDVPFRLQRLQFADFREDPTIGMATLMETLTFDAGVIKHLKTNANKISRALKKALKDTGKKRNTSLLVIGSLVLLVAIYWLITKIPNDNIPLQVTVRVHEQGKKDRLILPNRGQVKLIFGDANVEETINKKGVATFNQIPASFFEGEATVELQFTDPEGEPYRAVNPDSLYKLSKGQTISLEVKLFGLGDVYGIVKDFVTGKPLEGVRVSVVGTTAAVYTNRYGEYRLSIPVDQQRKFQSVRALKDGYQDYMISNVPVQTEEPLPIMMEPENP